MNIDLVALMQKRILKKTNAKKNAGAGNGSQQYTDGTQQINVKIALLMELMRLFNIIKHLFYLKNLLK